MQTRRDQLQAYRFQNRRALAALVKGEPNVLEPPMRRLTVTTLSGIMIAILIAAGFAAVGIIHPSAGDDWKTANSVIVDEDNSSIYVYFQRQHRLNPVLNYTSAVLALSGSGNGSVGRVKVSSDDIAGANYGKEIGIPGVPSSLPSSDSLVNFPMSVCSQQQLNGKGGALARVSLTVDHTASGTRVADSDGVLVSPAGNADTMYLLYGGERLPITAVAASQLRLAAAPLLVGTAFLDSVPQGPALAAPTIPGADGTTKTSYSITTGEEPVGTLVTTSDTHQQFVALADGLAALTPVQAALLTNVAPTTITGTSAQITSKRADVADSPVNPPQAWPRELPGDAAQGRDDGICAVFDSAGARLSLRLHPTSAAQGTTPTSVSQTATSRGGRADSVTVPATTGILARSGTSHTVVLISDQGRYFPFARTALLASFGYSAKDVVDVPSALVHLIPPGGVALDPSAARREVSG